MGLHHPHQPGNAVGDHGAWIDLSSTPGYLVVDCDGRRVGTVGSAICSGSAVIPDAIFVKAGLLGRHQRLVLADTIDAIDPVSRVIGLRVDRNGLKTFH
jgi:hypothetical protein